PTGEAEPRRQERVRSGLLVEELGHELGARAAAVLQVQAPEVEREQRGDRPGPVRLSCDVTGVGRGRALQQRGMEAVEGDGGRRAQGGVPGVQVQRDEPEVRRPVRVPEAGVGGGTGGARSFEERDVGGEEERVADRLPPPRWWRREQAGLGDPTLRAVALRVEREREGGGLGGRPCQSRCPRSEEHTSELQSRENLVCRLLLEKKKTL